MIVYKITNLIGGKVYVGKDESDRQNYYGGGIYIKSAIKKHGIENFKKEILEYCKTKKQLSKQEIYWIKKLNTLWPNGYNLTTGGEGFNGKHSEEAKQKISKGLKGHRHSEETKQKIRAGNLGKKRSKKTKQKMRKPMSEEAKQNMSKAQKGKTRSKKHRENISKARRTLFKNGYNYSKETRKKK